MAATDTLITLPLEGGICRVEMPNAAGDGKDIFHCSPQTVGRLLAQLDSDHTDVQWIDLLGATTPGIALATKRDTIHIVLSFPARVKEVRHRDADPDLHGGRVPFNLPPSVWVMQYHRERGSLQNAWFLVTATRVTSIGDTVPCRNSPFGNSHPGGNVCWGNVTLTHLTSQDPVAVDNLFHSTGFNHDLVDLGGMQKPDGTTFRETAPWVRWQQQHPTTALTVQFGAETFATRLGSILRRGE